MEDVFTLSWDDFNQKCPKVFKELWLDTDLSDVTLATEDKTIGDEGITVDFRFIKVHTSN